MNIVGTDQFLWFDATILPLENSKTRIAITAVHSMIFVRHYLQKSLYGVTTLQECGPNFFLVKLKWKLVFKVPILVTFDAAV